VLSWATLQPVFNQAVQYGYQLVERAEKDAKTNPILGALEKALGYAIVGGTRAGQTATYAALTALTGGAYMVPLLASVADDISYTLGSEVERKQFMEAMDRIMKDPELRNLFITELAGAVVAGAAAGYGATKLVSRLKPRLRLAISNALQKLGQKTGSKSLINLAEKIKAGPGTEKISLYKGGTAPEEVVIEGEVTPEGVELKYFEKGTVKYLGRMSKEEFKNVLTKLRKSFGVGNDKEALKRFSALIKDAGLKEDEVKALLDYIGLKASEGEASNIIKLLRSGSETVREMILKSIKEGRPVYVSKTEVTSLRPSNIRGLYEVEVSSLTEPGKTLKIPVFVRDGEVIVGVNLSQSEWSRLSQVLADALRKAGVRVNKIVQGSVYEALKEAGYATSVSIPPFALEGTEVAPTPSGTYVYVGVDRGRLLETLKLALGGKAGEEAYAELMVVQAKKAPITGRIGSATYQLRWVGSIKGVKSGKLLDVLNQFISEASKKVLTPQEFKELVNKYGKTVANIVANNPELTPEGQQLMTVLKGLTQAGSRGEIVIPVIQQSSGGALSLGVMALSGLKTTTAVVTGQTQKTGRAPAPGAGTKVEVLPRGVSKVITKLQEKGVTKVTSATDITQTLGVSETQAKEIFNKLKSSLKTVTVPVEVPKPEYITKEVVVPVEVEKQVPVTVPVPLSLVEVLVEVPSPEYVTREVTVPIDVERQVALTKSIPLSVVEVPVEILKPEYVTNEVTVPIEVEKQVSQTVTGVVVPVEVPVIVPVEAYDVVTVPVKEPERPPVKEPTVTPAPIIPPPVPSLSGTQVRKHRLPPRRGRQLEEVRL